VRAALMAGLAMMARLLGRRGNALTSLAATGVIMTAVRPSLLAEIGFQLSFAATLGLVLYAEPLEHAALAWFQPAGTRSAPGIVREVILLTLAAQMATLPLTAYYFGRLPATALPANFLILPLQPALMILGSLTAVAGMAWAPAGNLLGWITYPLASYNLRVVEGFARLPLASLAVGPLSPWGVLVSYGFLIALAAALHARKTRRKLPPSLPGWGWLAASAILAALAWRATLDSPDSRLHATLFSSGDVLVESPTGRFVLLRPASGVVLPAGDVGRRLPLMVSALDWMLLPTHDSAQGFLASRPGQRLIPHGVLHAGDEPDLSALTGIGAAPPSQRVYPNLRLDLGGGSELEVLAVSDQGAALLISMNRARVLILLGLAYNDLGKAAPAGLTAVLTDGAPRADGILEAGLVGGAGSAVDPPSGSPVFDTDHYGWIAIQTDGVQLWAESER
jgi:competence protein ComEC